MTPLVEYCIPQFIKIVPPMFRIVPVLDGVAPKNLKKNCNFHRTRGLMKVRVGQTFFWRFFHFCLILPESLNSLNELQ